LINSDGQQKQKFLWFGSPNLQRKLERITLGDRGEGDEHSQYLFLRFLPNISFTFFKKTLRVANFGHFALYLVIWEGKQQKSQSGIFAPSIHKAQILAFR